MNILFSWSEDLQAFSAGGTHFFPVEELMFPYKLKKFLIGHNPLCDKALSPRGFYSDFSNQGQYLHKQKRGNSIPLMNQSARLQRRRKH